MPRGQQPFFVVLEGCLATMLATPNFGHVLRIFGAQAVLESRTTVHDYPAEGYGHDACTLWPLHSSTAALKTQLSCGRLSKKIVKQKQNVCAPNDLNLGVGLHTAPNAAL